MRPSATSLFATVGTRFVPLKLASSDCNRASCGGGLTSFTFVFQSRAKYFHSSGTHSGDFQTNNWSGTPRSSKCRATHSSACT